MPSVLEILQKTTDFFANKGIDSPRLNAELLLGFSLGLKRMQLYLQFERILTEPELDKLRPLVRRRAAREPIQYIIGETEWGGLKLKVDRRALIPRPETEYLIELIASRVSGPPSRLLDLGTGTGALALALARSYPDANVTAVDADAGALTLARENATLNALQERVTFVQSDWFAALPAAEPFDLVVANPPYLSAEEVTNAQPEVRQYEPHSALVASEDGLSDLRRILGAAVPFVAPGGMIALETGIAQHPHLVELAKASGFARVESCKDLTERDRFVFAWR